MGRTLQAFSRYRPRLLTVLVVSLTTALLVLSNLSYVTKPQAGSVIFCHNYGWPLVWYRAVYADIISGWQTHRAKLALDVAVWLFIPVAAGGGCEWLMRRYRPPLRWSLRTMLIVTSVLAVFCACFTVASRRAQQQEKIVALFYGRREGFMGGHPAGQYPEHFGTGR